MWGAGQVAEHVSMGKMSRFLVFPALAGALLAGCQKSPEQLCLLQAMGNTGLSHGVMAYSDADGRVVVLRSGWLPLLGGDAELEMASLTKPLVAQKIKNQLDAGNIRLEQPIAELLPEGPAEAVEGVTIRRLLQHQAGYDRTLRDPLFTAAGPDCRGAARDVLGRMPERNPGESVIYSNAGYCVLGEVLLRHGWASDLEPVLREPLGAAGGWSGSVVTLHAQLRRELPLRDLSSSHELPDGSYYAYGWRHWPQRLSGPQWTHYGRLPGVVSMAGTDGVHRMLVAHFSGDPIDYEQVAASYLAASWQCFR